MNHWVLEAICETSWEEFKGGDWEWRHAGILEKEMWRAQTIAILRAAGLNVEEG